jgi:hypothetical protein
MFLFKLTDLKRVRSSGYELWEIDNDGLIAESKGGRILKISPDGKLLHVFEIATGDGTTNVAFSEGEKELYVTVVKDPNDPQAKSSIVKIANVK